MAKNKAPKVDDSAPPAAPPSTDYEGKQHYPKMLYHQTEAPRIVKDADEEVALETVLPGWSETPFVEPAADVPPVPPELPGVKA